MPLNGQSVDNCPCSVVYLAGAAGWSCMTLRQYVIDGHHSQSPLARKDKTQKCAFLEHMVEQAWNSHRSVSPPSWHLSSLQMAFYCGHNWFFQAGRSIYLGVISSLYGVTLQPVSHGLLTAATLQHDMWSFPGILYKTVISSRLDATFHYCLSLLQRHLSWWVVFYCCCRMLSRQVMLCRGISLTEAADTSPGP